MFDKFRQQLGKLGDLKAIQSKIVALQDQLAKEEIVVEEQGVRVVIDGKQRIKELSVQGISNPILIEVINKAISLSLKRFVQKVQETAKGISLDQ